VNPVTAGVYAGFLWAGYNNGSVAVFHIQKASVAAEQLAVADATITALAVDPQTGLCWVGTEEGVVVIVRWVGWWPRGVQSLGEGEEVGTRRHVCSQQQW
jgi:ligand-binding sensor domain-containing protein